MTAPQISSHDAALYLDLDVSKTRQKLTQAVRNTIDLFPNRDLSVHDRNLLLVEICRAEGLCPQNSRGADQGQDAAQHRPKHGMLHAQRQADG